MGNFVRLGANGIATNSHLKQIGGYSVIDLIVSDRCVIVCREKEPMGRSTKSSEERTPTR
jgi:hypothetical protein